MNNQKRVDPEERRRRKNLRAKQRYMENKEQIAAWHAERYKRLSADPEFRRKQAEKSAAYRAANPGVSKSQNAKRRASNPEFYRQRSREWFAANPDKRAVYEQNRRAKKRLSGGRLSSDLKSRLFELQKQSCACCHGRFEIVSLHIDHVIPLAKGGEHSDENIQLLCQPCNQSKHAKHPVDFMQERGFLL
jgi:5-methylcytosine-specific restriction endonuclease McrA